MISQQWSRAVGVALLTATLSASTAFGQTAGSAPGAAETKPVLPAAAAGDQVVVKRESPKLLPPQDYKVSLSLEPYTQVTLTAPQDGLVRQITTKTGARLTSQAEVLRFENTDARLRQQRAAALHKAATLEQKLAAKDETSTELAKARVEAAKAELDLTQFYLDQTTVRSPFAGEVLRILVTEGQFVRTGEPLVIVGDLTRMKAEIPVSRSEVQPDQSLAVSIDSAEATGKIEHVLPLAPRFDGLRDLFDSIASAVIVFDNPNGKLQPGQSVFVPMIPRQPIAQVSSSAVGNLADGQRKVQVVRGWAVRDVPVQLLGGIGPTRTFVSGPFLEGDEVIYETSHLLADGFQLKPAAPPTTAGAAPGKGAQPPTAPPVPAARNTGGF